MIDLAALEYPRHVHLPSVLGDWKSRIVRTAKECEAALAEGYALEPVIIGAAPVAEPAPDPMPEPPLPGPVAPAVVLEPTAEPVTPPPPTREPTDAERGFIRKPRK